MVLTNNLLLSFVAYAVVLFVLLWGIREILLYLLKRKKSHKKITFYFPIVQYLVWILFTGYIVFQLAQVSPFIVLTLTAILFLLGKSFLQNFFTGILFRLERGDLRDTSLTIGKQDGIINSFGMTDICLKSNTGNRVYVPYEHLYQKGFVRTVKVQSSGRQSVKVFLDTDTALSQAAIERIRKSILLNPYIATNENMQIITGEENGQQWVLISYTLANAERADYVKEAVRKEVLQQKL